MGFENFSYVIVMEDQSNPSILIEVLSDLLLSPVYQTANTLCDIFKSNFHFY